MISVLSVVRNDLVSVFGPDFPVCQGLKSMPFGSSPVRAKENRIDQPNCRDNRIGEPRAYFAALSLSTWDRI